MFGVRKGPAAAFFVHRVVLVVSGPVSEERSVERVVGVEIVGGGRIK